MNIGIGSRLKRFAARRVVLGLALVLGSAAVAAMWGHWCSLEMDAQVDAALAEKDEARQILQAAVDLESSARGFMLTGVRDHLEGYYGALLHIEQERGGAIARIDARLQDLNQPSLADALESTMRVRARSLDAYQEGGLQAVLSAARRGDGKRATDDVRRLVGIYVADRGSSVAALRRSLAERQTAVMLIVIASAVVTAFALAFAQRQLLRRRAVAAVAQEASERRGRELAALVEMGELLQSGTEARDVRAVVAHSARRLLPGSAGRLYALNNSRDRLDLAASWTAALDRSADGEPSDDTSGLPDHFGPSECWALKRGRPHVYDPEAQGGGLGCSACAGAGGGVCVPMAARGEVQGVLRLCQERGAGAPSDDQAALAAALGDGVSLALANMALRERLRNQALRDALTGLHNRRFFDEVLEKMEAQLQRDGRPVAVLMLDLDHFKSINDRHGHATGDATLRAVGAMLLERTRHGDIACRYGGEEIVVLLPGTDLQDAVERAEGLRRAVAELKSGTTGALPAITVSIGVAAAPRSAPRLKQAIEAADAALYEAKRTGRDRVCIAQPHAAPAKMEPPRLEVVRTQPSEVD